MMPCSATAELNLKERADARAERLSDELKPEAVNWLVDRMMIGQTFPKRGKFIDLATILDDRMSVDGGEIVDAVLEQLKDWRDPTLSGRIEGIVRRYFQGSGERWVSMRVQQMMEEE